MPCYSVIYNDSVYFCCVFCNSEVMKTLLNRYKDKLGLTQDQISEIEVMSH